MALTRNTKNEPWECLSTDTKPTTNVKNGQRLEEIDTSKTYKFNYDATAWVEYVQSVSATLSSTDVTLTASDIEIGAVEIKNSIDDTRATVGANGLYVDVQALPNTAEADISAIKTAVEIIDNAITGSEMQVDVVTTANSSAEDLATSEIGSKAITGIVAVTPASGYIFRVIQVITDTVVAAQGDVSGAINADLTAFTSIPSGTLLYGKWDSITLTSGEAIGHYIEE